MKQKLYFLIAVSLLLQAFAFAAKPQVVLGPGTGSGNFRAPYHQNFNLSLSNDTTYILTGWYFVDSTYQLSIEAGTIIRGDSASGGTLIVSRGAQIFATGTLEKPIVFTSNQPAGSRKPGDWGGVIILGNAPTNQPSTKQIEGGFGTIANTNAMYGGSNLDDNSGVFQYVRIEFAGIAFSQDNEINGITFGGVGRATTVDHVQVSFANDDDFEFFGGNVNAKYLVSWRSLDDTYDTDFGFSGKLQFVYAKRDPSLFDASPSGSSMGFESDNEGSSPYDDSPRTSPLFCNVTIVGPQSDTSVNVNSKYQNVAMIRRASELSIYNSILMGYPRGIQIRDTLSQRAALDNRLQIRNTSLQSLAANLLTLSSSPSTGNIAGFDVVSWFTTGTGNLGSTSRQTTDIGLLNPFALDVTNDPRPSPTSEPATAGTDFTNPRLTDPFFTPVSYRGAFDPSLDRTLQWDWSWVNYDPQNYDPEAGRIPVEVSKDWNLISIPLRDLSDSSKTTLLPTATSNAFSYNNGYNEAQYLRHGVGYWAKFANEQGVLFQGGNAFNNDTLYVNEKWNLIGSLASSVATSSVVSNPSEIVASDYFGYDNGYYVATELEPGKAYWVKVNAAGTLTLTSSFASVAKKNQTEFDELNNLNSLVVSNNAGGSQTLYFGSQNFAKLNVNRFELPPSPPNGAFDARYVSHRMIEVYPENVRGSINYSIAIQSSQYPVSIAYNVKENDGKSYFVNEVVDGKVIAQHRLGTNGVVTIKNSDVQTVELVVSENSSLPTQYLLSANYPNPFNPTTAIEFALVENAFVTLKVFSTLGQEVKTLINGQEYSAGNNRIQFDAGNLSSGTYFYKLTVQDVNSGKIVYQKSNTMMLVK